MLYLWASLRVRLFYKESSQKAPKSLLGGSLHSKPIVMIPQRKENAEMSVEMRLAIRILRGYTQGELVEKF